MWNIRQESQLLLPNLGGNLSPASFRIINLLCITYIFILTQAPCVTAIIGGSWLKMGMVASKDPGQLLAGRASLCSQLPGLSRTQSKICYQYPDHMPSVGRGALLSIKECQNQFKFGRWNCSIDESSNHLFGDIANTGTKESAFIHAVASAGVAYSMARSCREATVTKCHCMLTQQPSNLNPEWQWDKCGDNIAYGLKFSQEFVDAREREKTHARFSPSLALMLMNLHNNEAGRIAVHKSGQVGCKRHGVSGSCSITTCFQTMPSFRSIGATLRQLYESSVKVSFNKRGTALMPTPAQGAAFGTGDDLGIGSDGYSARIRRNTRPRLRRDSFVFLESSPDFCTVNPLSFNTSYSTAYGMDEGEEEMQKDQNANALAEDEVEDVGTTILAQTGNGPAPNLKPSPVSGRECVADSKGPDSCEAMCCGRGYSMIRKLTVTQCKCKFQWCCQIQCKTCRKYTNITSCF